MWLYKMPRKIWQSFGKLRNFLCRSLRRHLKFDPSLQHCYWSACQISKWYDSLTLAQWCQMETWIWIKLARVMSCCLVVAFKSLPGGRFKNAYELLTLRALKISMFHKRFIFQCMGKIFCVEFQRYPLKFHTKYLTHTLKDMTFIQHWNSKSS